MYKPTLYIKMEADPSRYNPEGEGLANRLWSFTAPVSFGPSPTMELGIKVRMKCSGRPYWDAGDEKQQSNWTDIARPFLKNKLAAIEDVLGGINEKRYNHYEGPLHFVWTKLQLDPFELRIRLDSDFDDNDYIPDMLSLVETVRDLANTDECRAFVDEASDGGVAVYLPSREKVEELKALREEEARAHAEWERSQADAAEKDGTAAVGGEDGEDRGVAEEAPSEPIASPGLAITTVEFVKPDGGSLLYDLEEQAWH